ncbi:sugar ABC transporter ATP-binding protein [Ponticoccus sp. SC2-23]|uniref:sugar ABC transporter ATP-binding protein n=1 Tax=Alexandriicola marinus TaxID=2081710 RepID=UPI000FDB0466|nr:sugar ABC transporter ATP-binding protein [Alexandriicola marinus]MBM1218619.1 sugar ABC transporter ATP-binding protein [Ponticoccus sp. SC6-9]MBM1224309.1 sugar ABC transporter ATP-binding protein [Ponticoccus sp. SC6-15]MBM1229912.1 sugar ABC transporter ATP-binding protein [Ponticoccus sp. SC6-38]MBM1233275.1 sugar ABC transporter ATP-binding protein [Ponticoccus sp. SC6-45]MBM1236775.1 sugar ABC transporter ATP-binding protein [Ponticoccus sp. SC6-49]MBM1242286.1 sugar ABC transporter
MPQAAENAFEMRAMVKNFGGVRALKSVDLAVASGEIHALLGENGAGKSTILKILQGVYEPTSGTIVVGGREVSGLTPRLASELGIGMIFQEMSLVPTLTVAQNIFLLREPSNAFGMISDRKMLAKAREIFASMGVDIDPRAEVGSLSAGQQQLTEIAKALSQDVSILILDEPTSALTASEVEILFQLLDKLRAQGKAIVYVSHRMDEIFRIADRATVLRDGTRIATRPLSDYTLETLIADIMGKATRDMSDLIAEPSAAAQVVLELRGVGVEGRPGAVDLVLHAGEVLGLAGLMGAGRSRIARTLFGLQPGAVGEIRINGSQVDIRSPSDAMALGIALVPEDRRRQGLVLEHSVEDNIALPVLGSVSGRIMVHGARRAKLADDTIARMSIKTDSRKAPANSLSGGNQQKIVIGKWLAALPEILIMDEPTAGIDIGSKTEIIQLVRALAAAGKSVIFISSELAELLAVSDRIAVMKTGSVTGTVSRHDLHVDPEEVDSLSGSAFQRAEQRLQLLVQKGAE